ncbi:type II secretion system F family protein [Candidatus Woesearchaeota archaeon]|nr:type II secretion system F family protein [Candidatus Woesearchaeota archaeon]
MKLFKKLKEKSKKRKRRLLEKKLKKRTKHYMLDEYLTKAGFTIRSHFLSRWFFKLCLVINLAITVYLIYFFATSKQGYPLLYILLVLFIIWALAFFLFLALIWLAFYLILDLRIFKRKLSIEEVLPDFLFLTATNIRSGMTTDKALWFAVRPRFGVLAKEIETVAKEVMSGIELTDSLQRFANKYESDILKRSINLLIEGIKSGGEIGDLLTRIASNIQESRLLRKEMSANVTTYVIFISFAAVVAAPLLLALSSQLIGIIGNIVSRIDIPASGNMMFAITDISVTPSDFRIFAYTSLFLTSFFSSIIIATIKKGSVKEGIKYIPLFIIISITFFLISSKVLEGLLGGIFI